GHRGRAQLTRLRERVDPGFEQAVDGGEEVHGGLLREHLIAANVPDGSEIAGKRRAGRGTRPLPYSAAAAAPTSAPEAAAPIFSSASSGLMKPPDWRSHSRAYWPPVASS